MSCISGYHEVYPENGLYEANSSQPPTKRADI